MEARELKDMTAVLRSINDGNPSNAERWVNLSEPPPARIGKSRTPKTMPGWPAAAPKKPSWQRGKHGKMQACGAGSLWAWALH